MNRLIIWLKQASHLSLGERKRIYVNSDLRNLILGNFCISCHSEDLWNIGAVTVNDCVHQRDYSMRKNCQMIHDLVRLAKQLESELARASPTMALLRPRSDILFLKHACSTLIRSCNPVCAIVVSP